MKNIMKRGPKSPRNKIKQMLVIEGHPDKLFKQRKHVYYYILYNGNKELLGKVSPKAIEFLKKVSGVQIIEEEKIGYQGIDIPHTQSIRKIGNNVVIVVSAPDEEKLKDNLITVKSQLERRGILYTERCQWICQIDKKDVKESKQEIEKINENSKKLDKNTDKSSKVIIETSKEFDNIEELTKDTDYVNGKPMKKETKKLRDMVIKMGIGSKEGKF